MDSSDQSIPDQDITLSTSGSGSVSLSKSVIRSGDTITVTGTSTGTVKLQAEALNATQTLDFTITGGNAFGFETPNSSPSPLATGTLTDITVNAPGVTTVRLTTTLGLFGNGAATIDIPVANGKATTTFSSSLAGIATISALDAAKPAVTASAIFTVLPPVGDAAKITVRASSSSTLGTSSGTDIKSISIIATVLNAAGQPIANMPVAFTIKNPVGGGESIAPAIAYTASTAEQSLGIGQASTTFISGSVVSPVGVNGINVVATVVGTAITAEAPVIIGEQVESVTIGQASVIEAIMHDTAYRLPMSVQVTDSGGNPVAGADVTLTVTPYAFSTGFGCQVAKTFVAEDLLGNWNSITGLNIPQTSIGNGLLDTDEDEKRVEVNNISFNRTVACYNASDKDANGKIVPYVCPNPAVVSKNNILEPARSAAGSMPSKVTTDASGIAQFNFDYLKADSIWSVVKVTASTKVSTTEASTSVIFRLRPLKFDVEPTCFISDSPYKQ
ncbi:hypothetical protein [Chitinimonas sp. BJB300]|uniref:hypothetical protein n=1 Tax=Chitinimonas sp. BJB300 TaxID=1559339 RepID=UPI00130476BC|nr:hypothetical protein [Chitinimonas sp. BJB300]